MLWCQAIAVFRRRKNSKGVEALAVLSRWSAKFVFNLEQTNDTTCFLVNVNFPESYEQLLALKEMSQIEETNQGGFRGQA